MKDLILRGARGTILGLSLILMTFLTVISFVSTAYFNQSDFYGEHPRYRMDPVLLLLLVLILVVSVLFFLYRKKMFHRIPIRIFAAAAVLCTIAASIVWVRISHTYPEADQKAVSWVAYLMTQDNFLFFEPEKYMQIYPNQLGLAAVLEFLYRIAGGEYPDAFRYLTALSNGAVVYLLYKITDRLFQSRSADFLVLAGAVGCVQIILYTTFLYGMMLGLAFALGAFYLLLIFLEKEKLRYAVLSGILIGISILVKNNYSIFLVAMVILLLWKALDKKSGRVLAGVLMILLICAGLGRGLTAFYEHRSGMEIGIGMPKILWVAMGMQEGERAEGWYNEFNYNTFLETGCDPEKSSAIAGEAIADSMEQFLENPAYAAKFYYKKTVSQWNEPTCEALWVNQFHSGDFSRIVQSIYEGKLYTVLEEYMNLFQSLVYAAVLAALWKGRKIWTMEQLFLPLVILGGFFFHTIWEAKSQYIFPYFVCFLPWAAAGLSEIVRLLDRIVFQRKEKREYKIGEHTEEQ